MGIVLFHLAMVAVGCAQVEFGPWGRFGRAVEFYGALTGSAYAYGFFAPGIDGQVGVFFDVVDERGKSRRVKLETGASAEADLRATDILEEFIPESDDDNELNQDLARSLSASLARVFFVRYPDTKQVVVSLENYEAISMSDYVGGKRAGWNAIYQAKYAYDKRATP